MFPFVLGFAIASVVLFTIPWVLEWRWMKPLKEAGTDPRSLTSRDRWAVYAVCGSSAMIIWAILYLQGYVPSDYAGVTAAGSMLISLGVTATLRNVLDVRPVFMCIIGKL